MGISHDFVSSKLTDVQTLKSVKANLGGKKEQHKQSKKKDPIIDVCDAGASFAPMTHLHRRHIITRQPLQ